VGMKFAARVQTGTGAQPASYTVRTGSSPGVQQPDRGVKYPPHVAPKLKKEQNYTSAPPLGPRDLFWD
jgi:hypothetical protein